MRTIIKFGAIASGLMAIMNVVAAPSLVSIESKLEYAFKEGKSRPQFPIDTLNNRKAFMRFFILVLMLLPAFSFAEQTSTEKAPQLYDPRPVQYYLSPEQLTELEIKAYNGDVKSINKIWIYHSLVSNELEVADHWAMLGAYYGSSNMLYAYCDVRGCDC